MLKANQAGIVIGVTIITLSLLKETKTGIQSPIQ